MPIILVVDDHRDIANAVAILTRNALRCKVIVAHDGQSALETLRANPIDLVILDNHMPGISGVEVLRRLQTAPISHVPYVIMYSADDGARNEALRLGAAAFIRKDEAPTALIPLVQQYLSCGQGT